MEVGSQVASSNKCHATRNKCLTSSKQCLLLETSAMLVVTSASLLEVTVAGKSQRDHLAGPAKPGDPGGDC